MRFSTSQQELLTRAIAALDERFDPHCNLLIHPAVERFHSVRESLCYAALVLVRETSASTPDPARIARANSVVDAVLATQVSDPSAKALGAFPLAWAADGKAADLVDADTRQNAGSMLAMLAMRFTPWLGGERVRQIDVALHRCCVGERAGRIAALPVHLQMMHAWLQMEHGYGPGGERLAAKITRLPEDALRGSRLGNAEVLAQQLWSIGLWFNHAKLASWAARFGIEAWRDVTAWRHPDLATLFGAGVQSDLVTSEQPHRAPGSERLWYQVWLTWLELTRSADLDLQDPRAAALLALPALAAQQDASLLRRQFEAEPAERAIEDGVPELTLSGWYEKDLHIEAARLPPQRQGQTVVAVYWPTRTGLGQLRCRTTRGHAARCDKRFVRLHSPGAADVQISGLGAGEARMIEGGWWLAGLHLGMEGFQITEAQRTEDGLRLCLRATIDEPLLLFAPLAG